MERCPTPTFSGTNGGTFQNGPQTIDIADREWYAYILYTTDGSNPSTSGTAQYYSGPISIDFNCSVKAVAEDGFRTNSYIATSNPFIFNCAPITFGGTNGGSFNNGPQTLYLATATQGAQIYVTIDGSNPANSSTSFLYNGTSLQINQNCTVRAVAIKTGYNNSPVWVSNPFVFTCSEPSISVNGGSFNNNQTLALTSATTNAQIKYTIDGSDPAVSSTAVVVGNGTPFILGFSGTLKAVAYLSGYNNSVELSTNPFIFTCSPVSFAGPNGGSFSNDQTVGFSCPTTTAQISYTLDGTNPLTSTSRIIWNGNPITISSDLSINVIAYQNGYTSSPILTSSPFIFQCASLTLTGNNGGSFLMGPIQVNLQDITANSTIYYTLDGSDPVTSSTALSTTGVVYIFGNAVLKAVAKRTNYANSVEFVSANFIFTCDTPVLSGTNGGTFYTGTQTLDISRGQTTDSSIYYTTDGSDPRTSNTRILLPSSQTSINVSVNSIITLVAEKTNYNNSLIVTSNSFVFDCLEPTIDIDGGSFNNDVKVNLFSSYSEAVYYTLDGSDPATSATAKPMTDPELISGNCTLIAVAKLSGYNNSPELITNPFVFTCLDPSISVNGGTYNSGNPVSVSLSDGTTGASIYYTTDGSDPTTSPSAVLYSTPFNINFNCVIRFIAKRSGYNNSNVITSNSFVFNCQTPVADVSPTIFYNGPQVIHLSCPTTGVSIYYTLDGSDPAISSTRSSYLSSLTINTDTTIRFIAEKTGYNNSLEVSDGVYRFVCADPTSNFIPGVYNNGPIGVSFNSQTTGVSFYYTLDGSDPKTSSTVQLYNGILNINGTSTLNFFARKSGYEDSNTISDGTMTFICSDPSVDVDGGSFNNGPVTVNMVSATLQANILYTLDGTDPRTTTSQVYESTDPIVLKINANCVLGYVVVKPGYTDSNFIVSKPFVFTCLDLTIDVNGGSYNNGPQLVNLATQTLSCTIIYTLDGSDPLTSSTMMSLNQSILPLAIDSCLTIRAVATKTGYNNSNEFTSNPFIFTCLNPILDTPTETITNGKNISIGVTNPDTTQTLLYTSDGTDPLTSSSAKSYFANAPLSFNGSFVFTIVATKPGYNNSGEVSIVITYVCADPICDTPSNTFYDEIQITLSKPYSSVTLKYTLDGTDPLTSSTAIIGSYNTNQVYISQGTTVRAICVENDYNNSNELSWTYVFDCTPPSSSLSTSTIYNNDQQLTLIPFGPEDTIMYSLDNGTTWNTYSSPITIAGNSTVICYAERTGWITSDKSSFTFTFQCGIPIVIGAKAGVNYYAPTTITLTSITNGASIYYTLDGTDPLNSSTAVLYSSPFVIKHTIEIKSIAKRSNYNNSFEQDGLFHVLPANPVFSPSSEIFYDTFTLTIQPPNNDENFTVYTLDGTAPTVNSTRYSSPLPSYESLTIKMMAVNTYTKETSSVVYGVYTKMGVAQPGETGPQTDLAIETLPNDTPDNQIVLLPTDPLACVFPDGAISGIFKANVTPTQVAVLSMGMLGSEEPAPHLARIDVNIDNLTASIVNADPSIPL